MAEGKSDLRVERTRKAIKDALKYDSKIIIEKYIENNRELECAILEKDKNLIVSNVGEILNNGSSNDNFSQLNK